METLAAELAAHGANSVVMTADLSQPEGGAALVRGIESRGLTVDVLINNAGLGAVGRFDQADPLRVGETLQVNIVALTELTRLLLPGMVARHEGSVVNVTSVSGYLPSPGEPAYGASKAALSRWSQGVAVDLAGTGVHVGVLSPGPIDTEIWNATGTEYGGKLYSPEVVARAAVRMIEREQVHVTSPRHFGAVGAVYPLAGRPMRWGLRRFAKHED